MRKKVSEKEKLQNTPVYCGNCGRHIGDVDMDYQSFRIWNSYLTVWETTRFICACRKPFFFCPQEPIDESGDNQTKAFSYKVLNGLGKVYSQSKKGES